MTGRIHRLPPDQRSAAAAAERPAPAGTGHGTAPDDVDAYRLAFDAVPVPLLVVDGAGTIVMANQRAATLSGSTSRALTGAAAETVLRGPGSPTPAPDAADAPAPDAADADGAPDADADAGQPAAGDHLAGLPRAQRPGSSAGTEVVWTGELGDRRRLVWTMTSLGPPLPGRFLLTGVDVTEHRAAEASWRMEAQTDPLTGLANRAGLHAALGEHLNAQRGLGCGLLFCDLDGFKQVNDTHGHAVGDALLTHVAARLRSSVRPGDVTARLGGDEFVVILPAAGPVETRATGMRIEQLISRPVRITQTTIRVGVSVGTRVAQIGEDPDTVLRDADAAMYEAKARRTAPRRRAG